MKKAISLLLAAVMIVSVAVIGAGAQVKTKCGGDCEFVPTIIIPGIGQSQVYLVDDNGDFVLDGGEKINCFPAYANVGNIIKKAIVPALLTLITQRDIAFSKTVNSIIDDCFYMNVCDNQGNPSKYAKLEEYPYSIAECSAEEKDVIYHHIPLKAYADIVGEDHLYYFAYNSFGNNIQTVDRLYEYIEMVKEETGHDKVNLAPISLGGTIANGLLEYYNGTYEGRPNVYDSINKMIYIVPAVDGSSIVGDVALLDLAFLDPAYLYNGFLEGLMDEKTARQIEILLRILPDDVLMNALNKAARHLVETVIAHSTNMWALIPSENYEQAAQMWLSDPSMAEIKKQTDMYYTAQLNRFDNISAARDAGVRIFNIVDYGVALYNVGNSWNKENADGVIDLNSTSFGVHAANVGETLPEGYEQAGTYCDNPEHNHISPDNVVDASTGFLPDYTFYFANQSHESTARNDIIMKLAVELMAYDNIENVYSDPNYPQFNEGRNPGNLVNKLIPLAKSVDRSKITPEQAQRLDAALAAAEDFVNRTACQPGEPAQVEENLSAVLIETGYLEAKEKDEDPGVFAGISLWMLDNFGTNGLSEYPVVSIKNFFALLFSLFKR